jgi:hypothetical protein
VVIPENVTSIGPFAFSECGSLSSVTFPKSVTTIGIRAFARCNSLMKAVFLGSAPTMGKEVFKDTASGFTVNYYNGAAGFTSPTWNDNLGSSWPAVNLGNLPSQDGGH